MSFESEALAHDELSLLDLFGPDASPRAQNIVQAAAERSMDEMAEVINAGKVDALSSLIHAMEAKVDAMQAEIDATDETYASSKALSEDKKWKIFHHRIPGTAGLTSLLSGPETPPSPVELDESSDVWSSFLWHRPIVGKSLPFDETLRTLLLSYFQTPNLTEKSYWPAISSGLRSGNDSRVKLFARDEELKKSLVHQLTEQLNAAIARGVDLSKVSVVLNAPNPESQRVEPVCIYADAATHMPRPLIIKQPPKAASKKY